MPVMKYYTKEEILNKPGYNCISNGKHIYLHQDDGNFVIYRKLYLLQKDATELTEIYLESDIYYTLLNYIVKVNNNSRYIEDFNGWVFFSIKDYFGQLDEANKNRLF